MRNPFNYLQFATGEYFYDREEIRKDLRTRLLSGPCNVVLYGPRRYGKSSLVAELTADLEKAGVPCVTIDIVKVPSIDLFVSAYAQKVSRRLAPVRFELRRLGELLKSLRPKMTVNGDGEVGFSFDAVDARIGAEVCARIGGSRRQAECRFRKLVGHSIGEEIRSVRIARAKDLLLRRHIPIESIFADCGYTSDASLRRAFRKATGCSLRDWRTRAKS